MMVKKNADKTLSTRATGAASGITMALLLGLGISANAQADVDVSGSIDIISDYVFRGYTAETESDGPAVQAGFDFEFSSGLYAGY